MDLLGYYTAGFFLCLIGEPQEYQNCIVYRSPNSFPTEEICHSSLVKQGEMLWYMFDQESFEVVDIRCIEWLPPKKVFSVKKMTVALVKLLTLINMYRFINSIE